MNDRALFILDKLIKRDITKFQAACAVAFPARPIDDPRQIQPDEVTRGPWLVILTRMGATREETTDILDRTMLEGVDVAYGLPSQARTQRPASFR